ncbi:MAG: DUF4926 domain-containing protein [Phycisphaerales bacterium]
MRNLYDCVRLRVPHKDVPAGALGAIVHVHPVDPAMYEVEFVDAADGTGKVYTVRGEDVVDEDGEGGGNAGMPPQPRNGPT